MTVESITASVDKTVEDQSVMTVAKNRITEAIRRASAATGVDFSYLMNKAAQESGLKAGVKASCSSATGLFQFIDQTWLQMVKNHGEKYGLGWLAEKINTTSDGAAKVSDRVLRQQILELRKNPELSASMAAELANENMQNLKAKVGGKIGGTELYLAHFLGPSAAAKFIDCYRNSPSACAADLLPDAADANKGVFYKDDGSACSVSDIYKRFAGVINRKVEIPETTTLVAAETAATPVGFKVSSLNSMLPGVDPADGAACAVQASIGTPFSFDASTTVPMSDSHALFSTMILAQLDMPLEENRSTSLYGEDKDEPYRAYTRTHGRS